MAWVYLGLAGLLEIVWASAMKHSEGFTKLWPTIISLVGMVASMILLSMAMKTLPLGTAYSVWTGIGAAGALRTIAIADLVALPPLAFAAWTTLARS